MPSTEDMTTWDGQEADIIAWPSDRRGRVINWRMTPEYARRLAQALLWADVYVEAELGGPLRWEAEYEALREAARRAGYTGPPGASRHGLGRLPDPLPRIGRAPHPDSAPPSRP